MMNKNSILREPLKIECNFDGFDDTIARLKEMGVTFITLSADVLDNAEVELNYFFQVDSRTIVINVTTNEKTIPSLYSKFQKSDFIEREINNIFGIKFLGHPNLERITSNNR